MPTRAWFLVQVRPNGLTLALRNLARQGFQVFAPLETVTKRVAGRFRTRQEALFPGYLFVDFDPASGSWRMINSTYGVARIVSFTAHKPAPVPDALVAALQARCDDRDSGRSAPVFVPGDAVAFKAGPFAELVGTIETAEPGQRVHILLNVMGQMSRVSAEPSVLRAAGAGAFGLAARGDAPPIGS